MTAPATATAAAPVPEAATAPAPATARVPISDPGRRSVLLAGVVYAAIGIWAAVFGVVLGRPLVALGLFPVVLVPLLRDRPVAAGVAMALGGTVMRAALVGSGPMTDQVETTQAALSLVLGGGNPYGAAIAGTSTGAPFPYGPLALVAYMRGVWTEVAAAAATMLLLAWARTPVVLAVYATVPELLRATVMGTNDILPGALVTAAVLVLAARPAVAGLLLALASCLKPFAAAWLPAVVGAGGSVALLSFAAASVLTWWPVLLWGPGAYVRSVQLADALNPAARTFPDVRVARLLAVPAAIATWWAARRTPSFEVVALGGTAVFLAAVLPANAGSLTYLLVPLPLVLIVAERRLRALASRSARPGSVARPTPQR